MNLPTNFLGRFFIALFEIILRFSKNRVNLHELCVYVSNDRKLREK